MGHDEHFLRRLDRVSDHHVELSLTLYRDTELLREVLSRADLPPGVERLAISLNDAIEGPFVIVTRDGHFVTCLGEGMRVGSDMVVLTRPRLDAAISKVERMRERVARVTELALSGSEGTAAKLFRKVADEGLQFCREDAETLVEVWPLVGSHAAGVFAESVGVLGKSLDSIAAMRLDRLRPSQLAAVNGFANLAWSCSTMLVLCTQVESTEVLKAFSASTNINAQLAIWNILFGLGTHTHGLRVLWSMAQSRGEAFTALRSMGGIDERERIAMRELGYAVIALKSSKLRAEATKALAPKWKGEPPPESASPQAKWEHAVRHTASAFGQFALRAVQNAEEVDADYLEHGRRATAMLMSRTTELTDEMRAEIPDDVARSLFPTLPNSWLGYVGELHAVNLMQALPWLARAEPKDLFLPRAYAERMPPTDEQDGIDMIKEIAAGHGLGRPETVRNETPKVGRNDPCTCGSGKKYKRCCGA